MPTHPRTRRRDVNEIAFATVQQATGEAPVEAPPETPDETTKNPAAVALGKLGASKGGNARAAKLSPEERSALAKRAARVRWGDAKKNAPA